MNLALKMELCSVILFAKEKRQHFIWKLWRWSWKTGLEYFSKFGILLQVGFENFMTKHCRKKWPILVPNGYYLHDLLRKYSLNQSFAWQAWVVLLWKMVFHLLNCLSYYSGWQVHSRGKALAKDVDFEKIARRTPGFTGADLQNLMNEAAILAARRDLKEISKDEISDALERIIAGPEKKNAVVSEEKKKLVAYHGTAKLNSTDIVTSSWCSSYRVYF